jgi:hypothetical protein
MATKDKMIKKLNSPLATGGMGSFFEAHVQASFLILMMTGGYAPCIRPWPITEIKLQGKICDYNTDDLIVSTENPETNEKQKLLCQVKHSISFTNSDSDFAEVMKAAWLDFNNPSLFQKEKDCIALITGPLSSVDSKSILWLLNQAKATKDKDEFLCQATKSNFAPPKSEEKLKVFRQHLKKANGDTDLSDNDLYRFLKHYYVLSYDLGEREGVILSLLFSHLSQINKKSTREIWDRAVGIVQPMNQYAGTMAKLNLPQDFVEYFIQSDTECSVMETRSPEQIPSSIIDWNQQPYSADLALINLIGSWNEKYTNDIDAVGTIISGDYASWIKNAKEIILNEASPLSYHDGLWCVKDRRDLWCITGVRIFDENINAFRDLAITVLSERDPSFDTPLEKQFMATILGKKSKYSKELRKGIAEGLALLWNKGHALVEIPYDNAKTAALLAIRGIFENADWILWGSLYDVMPVLAEAAPNEFLRSAERALLSTPCPFDKLLAEEGDGFEKPYYFSGILLALEALAWDEECFVSVCDILGTLAERDPDGRWSNRPFNSLVNILLPWYPQTNASIEKRKTAVKTLCREHIGIAWKLLLALLPNERTTSTGIYKPKWHKCIEDSKNFNVTNMQYWDQAIFYSDLAVSLAGHDTERLCELISKFQNLPPKASDHLLYNLLSNDIINKSEDERTKLWEELTFLVRKNRRHIEQKWALDETVLRTIEATAQKVMPIKPSNLYRYLFSLEDTLLYDNFDDFDVEEKKLALRRQEAVNSIFVEHGLNGIIEFVLNVKFPDIVGDSFGKFADDITDAALLPSQLSTDNQNLLSFALAYVKSRHQIAGWPWMDNIDMCLWEKDQIAKFLCSLPFCYETWMHVEKLLGVSQSEYWVKAYPSYHQAEGKAEVAVEKLTLYGRPFAALQILYYMYKNGNNNRSDICIKALLDAVKSNEPIDNMRQFYVTELIKALQEKKIPQVTDEEIELIEWVYLQWLDYTNGAYPKYLEKRLSNDPYYFCYIIQTLYRSDRDDAPKKETDKTAKAFVGNAWKLLWNWKTIPGLREDGSMDGVFLMQWINSVKDICLASGHIEIAINEIGKILAYAPSDTDGLWPHRSVAEVLNASDAEIMRRGFQISLLNSRGVYTYDPTGKPDLDLAKEYRKKAEAIENAGYFRLAISLRNIASNYEDDAKQIIEDHKHKID